MENQDLLPRPMWLEEFVPLVGKEIIADCSPAKIALTLVEAVPIRHPGVTDRPPFSLMFRSAPDALLVSGIYRLQCEAFGPDLVHLSPILAPPGAQPGYYYEAVFN
jgi:hypothetical protein